MSRAFSISILRLALFGIVAGMIPERSVAQPFIIEPNPFTVTDPGGRPFLNPFSGGLDRTRIGMLDVDGDDRLDLLTLNPGEALRLYRNEGSFRFVRDRESAYDEIRPRSWFRFADLDTDGDPDLFTSGALSELLILSNSGSVVQPIFGDEDTLRQTGGAIVYTEQQTVPAFVDIDADGDLDLFSGNVDGSITYYENVGTPQIPELVFRTSRYEGILVLSPARTAKNGEAVTTGTQAHGASVINFVDLDADNDLDMLFGDFFTKKLLHFENRGTAAVADFDTLWVDTAFAPLGDVVLTAGFNQATSGDLDGDADLDVIVSSLLAEASDAPMTLFRNDGTVNSPVMRIASTNPTSEVDVGRFATPVYLRDTERRGMLVGSEDGSLTWFEESEESGSREMRLARRFVLPGVTLSAPAAGDIDGDGRAEIVVGKSDPFGGILKLYRFDGNELVQDSWQLDTLVRLINGNASPTLGDVDTDGDLDLLIGARNGRFIYFENVGSPTTPIFRQAPAPPPFATMDLGSSSVPRFADLNRDAAPDLIVVGKASSGTVTDPIRFFINVGGEFEESTDYPQLAVTTSPTPLLLDGADGRMLLIGTEQGGLLLFRDSSSNASNITPASDETDGVPVRYDPTRDVLVVDLQGVGIPAGDPSMKECGRGTLTVVDATGRPVLRSVIATETVVIPVEKIGSGLYFWRFCDRAGGFVIVR